LCALTSLKLTSCCLQEFFGHGDEACSLQEYGLGYIAWNEVFLSRAVNVQLPQPVSLAKVIEKTWLNPARLYKEFGEGIEPLRAGRVVFAFGHAHGLRRIKHGEVRAI